jgi:hypothetical protein
VHIPLVRAIRNCAQPGNRRICCNSGRFLRCLYLPSIIPVQAPVVPIDLSAGTKVQGASNAPIRSPDESDSDSTESEDDSLFRIAHAIHRGESVQVALNGFFKGYQNIDSVVQFGQPYNGSPPDSLQSLFNPAFAQIAAFPPTFSSEGFPGSLYWATGLRLV